MNPVDGVKSASPTSAAGRAPMPSSAAIATAASATTRACSATCSQITRAPRSEFAFLLMLAVVAAYISKALGVYYLVGAFLVGAAAQSFRERLPALSSESLVHAVEAFA